MKFVYSLIIKNTTGCLQLNYLLVFVLFCLHNVWKKVSCKISFLTDVDKSKVVLVHVVKAYRGSRLGVELHSFLTSAVGEGERSTSRPGRFNPQGNNSGIGCRVSPRVSLDGFVDEKISYPWRDLNTAQSIPEPGRCTDLLSWQLVVNASVKSLVRLRGLNSPKWLQSWDITGPLLDKYQRPHLE